MMFLHRVSLLVTLLAILEFEQAFTRYERIGYVSDPVELLLRDSYSSIRNYRSHNPYYSKNRQIQKRRYSSLPPSFYTNNFGYDDMASSRRHVFLPYTDLLFNGR